MSEELKNESQIAGSESNTTPLTLTEQAQLVTDNEELRSKIVEMQNTIDDLTKKKPDAAALLQAQKTIKALQDQAAANAKIAGAKPVVKVDMKEHQAYLDSLGGRGSAGKQHQPMMNTTATVKGKVGAKK